MVWRLPVLARLLSDRSTASGAPFVLATWHRGISLLVSRRACRAGDRAHVSTAEAASGGASAAATSLADESSVAGTDGLLRVERLRGTCRRGTEESGLQSFSPRAAWLAEVSRRGAVPHADQLRLQPGMRVACSPSTSTRTSAQPAPTAVAGRVLVRLDPGVRQPVEPTSRQLKLPPGGGAALATSRPDESVVAGRTASCGAPSRYRGRGTKDSGLQSLSRRAARARW